MKAINVIFNGGEGTLIDWNNKVEDQACITQKYIINVATEKGTDPIFPDRGTDLLLRAIGGVVIDANSAAMIGNFAATDTIYFCSWEEVPAVYNSEIYPSAADIVPVSYTHQGKTLNFDLILTFRDGSSTTLDTSISSDG